MAAAFNARAARAKRPCPLWVDAFLRDTQHLAADEVGAYMLILMVMWSRETCDYPDDDARLARVCRVSLRLWKSRIGPAIRPFLTAKNGTLISKRLQQEAAYVEAGLQSQSDRRTGALPKSSTYALPESSALDSGEKAENDGKALKDNYSVASADKPRCDRAPTGEHPTQQPNNPTLVGGGGGSARTSEADDTPKPVVVPDLTAHEQILSAIGVHDVTSKWHSPAAIATTDRWLAKLDLADVIAEVAAIMRGRTGPPGSLRYFEEPMRRALARKIAPLPPLEPAPPDRSDIATLHPFPAKRRTYGERLDDAFDAAAARLAQQPFDV